MKKLLVLLLAATVVAGLAFAGGSQEGEGKEKPQVVNIFGAFVDEDANRFEKSMVPFEEETGIEVEYEGSADFESLITVRTEGGDPPDIAAFPQPGLMADLTRRGHVIDLNDWFSQDYLEGQYNETWLDLATVDGTMAGVWYRASLKSLVWYAVPIFEKEEYEIPQTWDEMLALSDQMVADGYTPWSITMESSGATGWVATDWMEDIMLRTQPPEKYDAWVQGELPFNSPEVKRAAQIMGEIWFNKDYVLGGTNTILTAPFGDGIAPIVQDPPRALMHRQANFILAFLPDPEAVTIGEELDYFYLPPIDEEEGKPVLGAGDCISAMEESEAIKGVMKYLTTGRSTKAWLQSGGFVSPHKDTPLDWYPTDADRGYAEILQNADTFRFDASDLMPGQVGAGSFWKGMVDYVSGEDLDKVMQRIDQSWPEE